MTWLCGGDCAQSSRFLWSRRPTSEKLHPCLWFWEEQVWGQHIECESLLIGPVGWIVCPPSTSAIQLWPTNWWTSWRDSRRHRFCQLRRRQLGTSRAHWGSTHRVGRRRCTERAHPLGTHRISSQGPSGKVGSTKLVLLSRLNSGKRCSPDCRTKNKL